jgi:hypothetical protein
MKLLLYFRFNYKEAPQSTTYNDPPPDYMQTQTQQESINSSLPPPQYIANTSSSYPITVRFTENPMQLQCPMCSATIITQLNYKVGTMTWFICLGFCFFG